MRGIVTDGAADIVCAVKSLFGGEKHYWCFAHLPNLVVLYALNPSKKKYTMTNSGISFCAIDSSSTVPENTNTWTTQTLITDLI